MKKILSSILVVAVVAVGVGVATRAFFSDTETSIANTFATGAIDLKIDSTAHYSGLVCKMAPEAQIYTWQKEDPNAVIKDTHLVSLLDQECMGSWTLADIGTVNQKAFFNYADLKPGDTGENTISLHMDNNDAYVCATIKNMVDEEVGVWTEPEAEVDQTTPQGELAKNLMFFAWAEEDGNNIFEPAKGEVKLFTNTVGDAEDVLNGKVYPLYTPATGAMPGNSTKYIGLAWCAGTFIVNTETGAMSCSGASMGNEAQTDKLTADIEFYVEQARNNPDFTCPQIKREFRLQTASTQNGINQGTNDYPWYTYAINGLCIDFSLYNPNTWPAYFDFQIDGDPGSPVAGLSDILISEGPLDGQLVGNLYSNTKVDPGQTKDVTQCGTSEIKVGIHFGAEQLSYLDWATFVSP